MSTPSEDRDQLVAYVSREMRTETERLRLGVEADLADRAGRVLPPHAALLADRAARDLLTKHQLRTVQALRESPPEVVSRLLDARLDDKVRETTPFEPLLLDVPKPAVSPEVAGGGAALVVAGTFALLAPTPLTAAYVTAAVVSSAAAGGGTYALTRGVTSGVGEDLQTVLDTYAKRTGEAVGDYLDRLVTRYDRMKDDVLGAR